MFVGLLGQIPLDAGDRQGAVADEMLEAVALALLLDRTKPRADFRKDVRLADDLVGLAFLAIEEQVDEPWNLDARRAGELARRLLALAAIGGQAKQIVSVAHATVPEDRPIDGVVPHDAAGPAGVPHDLRARAAPDADLLGVHLSFADDVAGEVGIGEGHASTAHDGDPSGGLVGGADVGHERAQPTVTGADESHVRIRLLHLSRDVHEPRYTGQGMLGLRVAAHDGFVERPADVRIVVGIGDRDVDQSDAVILEQADELLRFGQIGLGVVVLVDRPAVGVGDGVVDAQSCDDLAAQFAAHALDGLDEQSRAVLERTAVLARTIATGQQFVDQIAVTGLDIDGVEADLERDAGRLGVGVLEPVEIFVRHERVVVGELALALGVGRPLRHETVAIGIALSDDRPGDTIRLAVSARMG